jgi:hypothetical protein
MFIVFAIHYPCLLDHMVVWAIVYFVATQLLKDDLLKANVVNQCLPLSLINSMLFLLSMRCTYAYLFIYYLDKNLGWVTNYDGYAKCPEDY